MKKLIAALLAATVAAGCAAPQGDAPSAEHGFSTAASGVGHLVLSPLQIVAGLLEGIAAVPYFVGAGVHDLNQGLVQAEAEISLDDTYEYAYGAPLARVPASGETGVVYRRMKRATGFFQTILRRYGLPDAERYILTSVKTANNDGYTLYAVVHRPADSIRVIAKQDGRPRTYTRADRLFYEPYAQDAQGRPLDQVIDWAAVPRSAIKTQKGQAILLTLAANAVLNDKRTPVYWDAERRWIDGQYRQVVAQRTRELERRIAL